MDYNFDNIGVPKRTGYTQEELEAIALTEMPFESVSEIIETKPSDKVNVPIYELKADEEARTKLRNHQEEADYEALVAKVKEWLPVLADKTELDHRALAVIIDDHTLFEELKRSHKALNEVHADVTSTTNKWSENEKMYEALENNIADESNDCAEIHSKISKLM